MRALRFSFVFLFIWVSAATAEMVLPPPLKNSNKEYYEKLMRSYSWISNYLRPHVNNLNFTANAPVPAELYHQNSIDLIGRIKKIKGAAEAMEARPELLNFEIHEVGSEQVRNYYLSSEVRKGLEESSDKSLQLSLEKRLQQKGRFQGALTAVLSLLPKETAKKVFALGAADKQLSFIEKHWDEISEDVLKAKFNGELFDLESSDITKANVLKLLQRLLEQESAGRLAFYALLLKQKYPDQSLKQATGSLSYASIDDFKADAAKLLENFVVNKENIEPFIMQLVKGDFLREEKASAEDVIQENIVVHELAPFPAIFRGIVGSDCATDSSWAFAFSPFERIFLISIDGEDVGYIGGTTVTVGKRPAFYLRDIVGPRLTSKHVDLIIGGFSKIQKELGVQQIVLATPENLEALNSVKRIIGSIQGWYEPKVREVSIQYDPVDVRVRKVLLETVGLQMDQDYDMPENNATGIKMRSNSSITDSIKIEFKPETRGESAPATKLTKQKLHDFLMLSFAGSDSFKDELSPEEEDAFWELSEVLQNQSKRKLSSYYKDIEKLLSVFDLQLSQNLIHAWPDIFATGHLRAIDVVSDKISDVWQKNTIDFVIDRIMRSPDANLAYQVIRMDPEFFEQSEKFQRMVRSQISPGRQEPRQVQRLTTLTQYSGIQFARMMDLDAKEVAWLVQLGFGEVEAESLQRRRETLEISKDLTIEELNEVAAYLDPDRIKGEDFSTWAVDLLYKHKKANAFILKELGITIRDDDSPRVVVPAALLYLQLAEKKHEVVKKTVARAIKVLAKWSKDESVPKEYQREARKSYGEEIKKYLKDHKNDSECEEKLKG